MSEDFDPSPRTSKRRKADTHGSSQSIRSGKDCSESSIWNNVSSSVTGFSRRLFPGSKSSTHVDESAVDLQDDSPADRGLHEPVENLPEVAGSEDELLLGRRSLRSKRGGQVEGISNNLTRASKTKATTVNGGHGKAQHSNKKTATGGRKQTESFASHPASGRQSDKGAEGLAVSTDDTPNEIMMNDTEENSITVQPRSSGRARKKTRRYSVEPVEIQETPTNSTESKPGASAAKKTQKRELVGILTPSKRNEKRARKSVLFSENETPTGEELGFTDIPSSEKQSKALASELQQSSIPSRRPKKLTEKPREVATVEEPDLDIHTHLDEDPLFDSLPNPVVEDPPSPPGLIDITEDSTELQRIKAVILARLTRRAAHAERPPLPSHLQSEYDTLHTLLRTTVLSGESNSLLLLGSRGAGKSLLVNTALENLRRDLPTDFHTVRLNGFIQTDDRLALREIWRQLGREMEVDEAETNQVVGSYADTMTSLLGLLSQPEEVPDIGAVEYAAEKVVTKSVVFILDEFDLFTTHPRQTLLYNLFDIAQSRKAPIAVIGCSARTDCVECLEKRVKSRFSHRWVHVSRPKNLAAFEQVVLDNLLTDEKRVGSSVQQLEWSVMWNDYIKTTFLPSPSIQSLISSTFHTTKSLPSLFAALYQPIATATLPKPPNPIISSPPSLLSLLPSLPTIHLALLVCTTRLEAIHSLTQCNFNIVHAHYTDLITKSRLSASAAGAVASGMRKWGRDVCLRAWEELIRWEVVVKAGREEGVGMDQAMCRVDVTIEEVRWAVERAVGVGDGLARWCREV